MRRILELLIHLAFRQVFEGKLLLFREGTEGRASAAREIGKGRVSAIPSQPSSMVDTKREAFAGVSPCSLTKSDQVFKSSKQIMVVGCADETRPQSPSRV